MRASKLQKQWREERRMALSKINKSKLVDAIISMWDLIENHNSLSGSGFRPNGDWIKRDDYAVVFPDEAYNQTIEKLLPKFWETKTKGQKQ